MCQSIFFNKVTGPRSVALSKKEALTRVFSSEFYRIISLLFLFLKVFCKIPFFIEHLQWVLCTNHKMIWNSFQTNVSFLHPSRRHAFGFTIQFVRGLIRCNMQVSNSFTIIFTVTTVNLYTTLEVFLALDI